MFQAKHQAFSKKKIYESEPFDEGNPPKELKSLIELILALAESVE